MGGKVLVTREGKIATVTISNPVKKNALNMRLLGELRRAYSRLELSDEDVSVVLCCLDSVGAQAYCRQLAQERKAAALAELGRLGLKSDAADELKRAAACLLEGDF